MATFVSVYRRDNVANLVTLRVQRLALLKLHALFAAFDPELATEFATISETNPPGQGAGDLVEKGP
jgi:hypothetical protein